MLGGAHGDLLWEPTATNPAPTPRPNSSWRALFPPQAQSLDKGHGRVEHRQPWTQPVDGATLGLAGAAQVFRLEQQIVYLCRGQVYKTTPQTRYAVCSQDGQEAGPDTEVY